MIRRFAMFAGLSLALVMDAAGAAHARPAPRVVDIRAAPVAGQVVWLSGYVVGIYTCPPCPPRAECKPCAHASSVTIADSPAPSRSVDEASTITLAVSDETAFRLHAAYKFHIRLGDRARDGVDGRVLGFAPG